MAELVDALVSGTSAARRGGSSPLLGTIFSIDRYPIRVNIKNPAHSLVMLAAMVWSGTAMAASPKTRPPPQAPPPAAPMAEAQLPVHPDIWPKLQSGVADDPAIEARVADILGKMTLEEKVGQIMQADIDFVKPADVKT